jgi:crotonobetainyl-CoA:carnitine CoA-transferase CaiB-like acyl-CoA transferase
MTSMAEPLLAGIRVLDLTTVVVGPAATLRLADYGAEVIKVEAPEGDLMRVIGGPSHSGELSGKFMHFNRAKRFACLNLKVPSARAIMQELMARCDVFVSNVRPDALERLGLDARTCMARHPGLIHCVITGFGPGGPYRGRPAYDTVLQGASGIAGLSERRDGTPNYVPFLAVDHVVGEITAGAISAALFKRLRTGQGAALEIPMHETMAGFVLKEHLGAATFRPPLGAPGDMRVLDKFNRPAATQDGWITITANSDAQAAALLRTIGREDLIADPRFRTVADRYRHASDWFAQRAALKAKPTAYWLHALAAVDVPAMPCHTLDTLAGDPHLTAVGLTNDVSHPIEGLVTTVRPSILIDDEVPHPDSLAKPRGWDTAEILGEIGIPPAEIAALIATGAVYDGRAGYPPSDADSETPHVQEATT